MPRPKTSGRNRKPRKAAAGAKTEGGAAASQPLAPSDIATAVEMTIEDLIRGLNDARQLAIKRGRAAAAVNATVEMGRLMRLLPDKPGRPPSLHKPGRSPAPPAKFDGNYNEAARRIALLLRLAAKERAEEADGANGQKRDRPS
jgi:hypothetical protein